VTLPPTLRRIGPALLVLTVIAVLVSGCIPGTQPTGSDGLPIPTPPAPPLEPVQPTDLFSLFAWLFTPIFQAAFIVLIAAYQFLYNLNIEGAILWAIVFLTLVVRVLLIPLFRRQLVSQRRMQLIQPELREIQKRFKGDTMKARLAQQELFRERGINPLAGCLPLLLQLPLLLIIYTVIQNGLTNVDPSAMLTVFGVEVVQLECVNINPATGMPDASLGPCVDTTVPILGDVSQPQTLFSILGVGISVLAIISSLLQLVQSRMMLPAADPDNTDPNVRIQRQTMLFLPLISVIYGGILPAGLFVYWIVATVFQIVQQYLVVGWGSMFPIFGWTPGFARDHTPRFPVQMPPPPDPSKRAAILTDADKRSTAERTIRHRERGRQGRRGRRR
jgi:YidC/Oxa1 family membrane protein insertase